MATSARVSGVPEVKKKKRRESLLDTFLDQGNASCPRTALRQKVNHLLFTRHHCTSSPLPGMSFAGDVGVAVRTGHCAGPGATWYTRGDPRGPQANQAASLHSPASRVWPVGDEQREIFRLHKEACPLSPSGPSAGCSTRTKQRRGRAHLHSVTRGPREILLVREKRREERVLLGFLSSLREPRILPLALRGGPIPGLHRFTPLVAGPRPLLGGPNLGRPQQRGAHAPLER